MSIACATPEALVKPEIKIDFGESRHATGVLFSGQGHLQTGSIDPFIIGRNFALLHQLKTQGRIADTSHLTDDEITSAQSMQAANTFAGLALARHFLDTYGAYLENGFTAGHSLNEISAAYFAGMIGSIATALSIGIKRGGICNDMISSGEIEGEMRIVTVKPGSIEPLWDKLLSLKAPNGDEPHTNPRELIKNAYIANDNSWTQTLVSGETKALDQLELLIHLRFGHILKRVTRAEVGGPYHSPMMQPAAVQLGQAIAELLEAGVIEDAEEPKCASKPSIQLLSPTILGRVADETHLAEVLPKTLTDPVRFRELVSGIRMNVAASHLGSLTIAELGLYAGLGGDQSKGVLAGLINDDLRQNGPYMNAEGEKVETTVIRASTPEQVTSDAMRRAVEQ